MTNTILPLKPLIVWSGVKEDEIQYFDKYLPSRNGYSKTAPFTCEEMNLYIDPFVGAAATYFHIRPPRAVLSDIYRELIVFYREISNGKAQEIYQFMKEHANEEDMYYRVRDQIQITTSLDVACKFYYLRKTCYMGLNRYNKRGNFIIPYGNYDTIDYEDIKSVDYSKLLCGSKIIYESFEEIFALYNDPSYFMFLNPPYDTAFINYNKCIFGEKEHRRLAELFKQTKNKCLIVVGKTQLIIELYSEYIVEEYETINSEQNGDELNTVRHVIIKNW